MVLIFGFGPGRAQDRGEVAPLTCPACGNDAMFHHVVSKKSFSLFFVPVVPYGKDEYLLCPVCTQVLPVPEDVGDAVEGMKSRTAAWRSGDLAWERYEAQVESFWVELGVSSRSAGRVAFPGPEAGGVSPSSEGRDLAERVEALARMHERGEITDEQFDAAKARLLE